MANERYIPALNLNRVALYETGNSVTFEKDGLILYARSGNVTTAVSCPTYTNIPPGLRFTLDNSNGSGSLTMTPVSGTPIVVTAGKVFECLVSAAGAILASELTAAPT